MKRSPLRRVSKKQSAKLRLYSKQRKEFLEANPSCQYGSCAANAEDLHHKKGRGKFLNDPEYFMAICRYHHDMIHRNPAIARFGGYLK